MTKVIQIRDVPDRVHTALVRAAEDEGMSLTGYLWELRHNLSGYDATYAALAESLDVQLLTTDRGLAGAPGLRCLVELV